MKEDGQMNNKKFCLLNKNNMETDGVSSLRPYLAEVKTI